MIANDRVYCYQSYCSILEVCKFQQVYAKVQVFLFYACRDNTPKLKVDKVSVEKKKKHFEINLPEFILLEM